MVSKGGCLEIAPANINNEAPGLDPMHIVANTSSQT